MCFRDLCPLHLPCVLALYLVAVLSTSTSEAGVSVTLYGGKAATVDTRVRLIEPPDTDLDPCIGKLNRTHTRRLVAPHRRRDVYEPR